MGYYTSKIGRFVYAFPVASTSSEAPRTAASLEQDIPEDAIIEYEDGERVANEKYCAGFIDGNQVFHRNADFMKEEPQTNEAFEADVQARVREIRQTAATEGRKLYAEESAAITGLAREVQRRRDETVGKDPHVRTDAEVMAYARDNDIDVAAATSAYEVNVQRFVRGLRARADLEGRKLSPYEMRQITLAAETVKDARDFAARNQAAA